MITTSPTRSLSFEKKLDTVFNLLLPDKLGIHIPRVFADCLDDRIVESQDNQVRSALLMLSEEDRVGSPLYWADWDTVHANFAYTNELGTTFRLYEGYSLWSFDQTRYDSLTSAARVKLWDTIIF